MIVRAAVLPTSSALHALRRPRDFLDCYACEATIPVREAAKIVAQFPGWGRALLAIRNRLMAPFGLTRTVAAGSTDYGPFPLVSQTDDEVILGFDDRHLDFRISVLSASGRIHCATWVAPHHLGGRAYLTAIMPFHILIVRNAVARVARAGKALA